MNCSLKWKYPSGIWNIVHPCLLTPASEVAPIFCAHKYSHSYIHITTMSRPH